MFVQQANTSAIPTRLTTSIGRIFSHFQFKGLFFEAKTIFINNFNDDYIALIYQFDTDDDD